MLSSNRRPAPHLAPNIYTRAPALSTLSAIHSVQPSLSKSPRLTLLTFLTTRAGLNSRQTYRYASGLDRFRSPSPRRSGLYAPTPTKQCVVFAVLSFASLRFDRFRLCIVGRVRGAGISIGSRPIGSTAQNAKEPGQFMWSLLLGSRTTGRSNWGGNTGSVRLVRTNATHFRERSASRWCHGARCI